MKLALYNVLSFLFLVLFTSCEEDSVSNSDSGPNLESTLNESSISGYTTAGNVDDYFYKLDGSMYNSTFYHYSGLSILSPINFDESEDTLNYSNVTDYVLEFTPSDFDPSMIALEEFDETVDNIDVNNDGSITQGGASGLHRFEEVKFSVTYLNLLNLDWDFDNSRYTLNFPGNEAVTLDSAIYIGDPDKCTSIGSDEDKCDDFIDEYEYCEWVDTECRFLAGTGVYEDKYDSLVYIADINYNDLNGFTFTDCNESGSICEGDSEWDGTNMGNGQWDQGEPSTLDNQIYSEYYFDQTELVLNDSAYSSVDTVFSKLFSFDKWVLSSDSLIFKVSTDCNDNGQWDSAEITNQSECLNGFWNEDDSYCDVGNGVQDPAEPYIDLDDSGEYEDGEEYLDRNCNGRWDAAEGTIEADCPLTITDGDEDTFITGHWTGSFCDLGNFQKDGDEECADGTVNCDFEDLYEMSTKPEVLLATWDSDNSTWLDTGDGTAYRYITRTDVISPRWDDEDYQLIQQVGDQATKTKEVSLVDSVRAIYSYPFIENMISQESFDYTIFKTVSYDSDGRNYNYLLNRKDENGNIVTLGHDSYFSLPTVAPGSSIDGGSYSNYLVFDEYPTERTFLYTHGGMLRDGEYHQTYRQGYSTETFAYYDIYETYEVSHEPVILPLDTLLDGTFPDSEYTLDDVFKITRTKKTVMLGPDLEVVEENKVWLARDKGIVKDEMSFRFNEPDDFDGYYKLELARCYHCDEANFSSRQSFFDNRIEVGFNELNTIDGTSDEYKKVRTYGIQALPLNIQNGGGN